jgi:hypothetical protein
MSRESLINTLRDALEQLTQTKRDDEDIDIPEIDDAILAWAEIKPRRRTDLPLSW